MKNFNVIEPSGEVVPIIVSVPHAGTFFPEETKSQFLEEKIINPDDTDWFVDQLYGFASELGATMVVANVHRWVIDLNRDFNNLPLYNDGRVITALCPTTDFNGENLYKDGQSPDSAEISRRIEAYYKPYYQVLEEKLQETKKKFGKALLFDAHSIRKHVPGIRPEPFPEFILGDNDQTSADQLLITTVKNSLMDKGFEFSHNFPFKGGFITRNFGKPEENIHALQLEMTKTNYMHEDLNQYDVAKAEKIQKILKQMFLDLEKAIQNLT